MTIKAQMPKIEEIRLKMKGFLSKSLPVSCYCQTVHHFAGFAGKVAICAEQERPSDSPSQVGSENLVNMCLQTPDKMFSH